MEFFSPIARRVVQLDSRGCLSAFLEVRLKRPADGQLEPGQRGDQVFDADGKVILRVKVAL